MPQRLEIVLRGRVQGVGFRPFVYRLATHAHLSGWVRNENGQLRIQVQGETEALQRFQQQLLANAPLTSQPELQEQRWLEPIQSESFCIKASYPQGVGEIHVPPDFFLCPDCLAEIQDPENRRHDYPFINCTACGPRYSIINALPYDRPHTSMAAFNLCDACENEYRDPNNRRFHAEPLACPDCGPQLIYEDASGEQFQNSALNACVNALQHGDIVLIKGIGGYHLCCDAENAQSVSRLRQRKHRPHKPLALMFPSQGKDELQYVREQLDVSPEAARWLRSPARPIVLLPRRECCNLPDNLAPELSELGVMLPYSPLHTLLLSRLARPIVATSANISGEPVLTENESVRQRLSDISRHYLHHNRTIVRPVDDPVMRIIGGKARPLRLGRGLAPLELTLPGEFRKPVLACGGQMKTTVALAWQNRVVISPHIGDLDSPRSRQVYAKVIADLQTLYQIEAEVLIHDQHPGYYSSQWAKQQNRQTFAVAHHHAHAAVLAGEYPEQDNWLVFTWDGVGLGQDQSLWGGEAFYGRPGSWLHSASWRPFVLPGGDRVAREPWRSALSLCWHEQLPWHASILPDNLDLLYHAWQKQINSARSSAVGRLFDAAAAILGLCPQASFEGQAAMYLENVACKGQHAALSLPLIQDGAIWRSDWAPLLKLLLNEKISVADRAYAFHNSLAHALVAQATQLRQQHGDFVIGLCGGAFQNRLLCELVQEQCKQAGMKVYLPRRVPVNDGGLCYGQIIQALAQFSQGAH